MAPLNAASTAALARLRVFQPPPFPTWDRLPVSRRAAVLLLLFADHHGALRVVITMRAASLRDFSGHAALPGGKADHVDETPHQIARREAYEEIGLPIADAQMPAPFHIEHLCYLPHSLARTGLAVRPCVALVYPRPTATATPAIPVPEVQDILIPRLDPKEVAALFSAPLHNFLLCRDEGFAQQNSFLGPPPGQWYRGRWTTWHSLPWRLHYFFVPVDARSIIKPKQQEQQQGRDDDDEDAAGGKTEMRCKVWGMTARILVDAARVAYGREPEFEHDVHMGDEELIERLYKEGGLGDKKRL